MSRSEDKIVFAVSQTPEGPLVVVGVPAGAWEFMKDGRTHHFDLGQVGLPLKLMMFGGKDHETCMKTFEQAAKEAGAAILDSRNKDFGIKKKDGGEL